jgi:hypothetical protein
MTLNLKGDFAVQTQRPYQIRFSAEETRIIDSEILKYLSKRVIEPACVDGSNRMILNIKPLNEFVDYTTILKWIHFKLP